MSKCPKCGGSGLIPFIGKSGKVIPGTFLHCECNPDYGSNAFETGFLPTLGNRPANTMPLRKRKTPSKAKMRIYADDFDFSMSEDFWKGIYKYHGWPDPTPVTANREVVREVVVERQPANMLPIKSEMVYLQNKLNEHVDAAKKAAEARKKKQVKQSYKGIK